jgi:hypothetical protein
MSKNTPESTSTPTLGVGCDIGTMNIVSARRGSKGIESRRVRDAFLDLDPSAKRMLKLSGVDFFDRNGELLIVGDKALEIANVFGKEARRPLSQGLLAAGEIDALEVLGLLMKQVLGDPAAPNEACYYSVPAAPVDAPDRDVIYHRGVLGRIVTECGFRAVPSNEAMAVIFNETAKDGFSGVGISFGSGMTNVALAVNTIEGMSFSVARGGDWIDAGAAKAVGSTQARMCALKEGGIDLMKPIGREQEAMAVYYKNLIEYTLDNITAQFARVRGQFSVPRAIPVVVAGGTSLAGGFINFFGEVLETRRKKLPFEVSEVRHAKDPLGAIAHGLLLQAMQEYE